MDQRKQFFLCLVGQIATCLCLSTIPPFLIFLTEQKHCLTSSYVPFFEKYITVLQQQHIEVSHCFSLTEKEIKLFTLDCRGWVNARVAQATLLTRPPPSCFRVPPALFLGLAEAPWAVHCNCPAWVSV